MIISTRGLYRCMTRALATNGYAVSLMDDWLYIGSPFWCTAIQYDILPRTLLGLIVSHIGDIPKQNNPLHLQKVEKQIVLEHTDKVHLSWLSPLMGTQEPGEDITRTAVTIGGLVVLQQEDQPKACYLANAEYLDIVHASTIKGNRLVCRQSEGCLYKGRQSAAVIRLRDPDEDEDGVRLTDLLQRLTGAELSRDY